MYVLIVSRGYPTEKYKMNGIFEFDQAKALAKSGCKVVYAAIDVRSIRRWRKWGMEKKHIAGVEICAINIPVGRVPHKIFKLISMWGLKVVYRQVLKEYGEPDIVHAHFANIANYTAEFIKKVRKPFVVTEHYSPLMKIPIDQNLFNMASEAYEEADAIIAVSPALKEVIDKKFSKSAIYIPNIVDTSIFDYHEKKEDKVFRFVSVGGLIERKRMDLTIRAFSNEFANVDSVELVIFGEGSEKSKLEGLINKYEINDKVRLMGLQSREKISNFFKNSDCFVLASQAETFGVVYIEALASGLPVIATKCGGPENFVNSTNGHLVPINNLNALQSAMRNVYENEVKYDKKVISETAKQMFGPTVISKKTQAIYKNCIEQNERC